MPEITTLFLVRHAATEHNERRPVVLQGNAINGPLSELGRQQAAALGQTLAGIEFAAACVSSMVRAQETLDIALACRPSRIPIQVCDALQEINVGRWEGLSWVEVQKRDPDHFSRFIKDPSTVPYLGGETYQDVLDRARPPMEEFVHKHRGQTLLAVSHNVVVKVLVSAWMGLNLREARKLHQSNCAINIVKWIDDEPEVFVMNADLHVPTRSGR